MVEKMDNAKTKLDEHLLKYGIDISEIDRNNDDKEIRCWFKKEHNLLTNIILSKSFL